MLKFEEIFSRHGAWLTFGNIDLHLIKGRPAVHGDDDLIVSHIALVVKDMEALKVLTNQNTALHVTQLY